MKTTLQFLTLVLILGCVAPASAREWVDSSGHYKVEADLVARNDKSVVLRRSDDELIIVEIDELSDKDKEYLASDQAQQDMDKTQGEQKWILKNGMEIAADVVEYGRRDIEIRRRGGKYYVNDKLFDNLPEIYRRMVPKIVEYFEKTEFKDEKEFKTWVRRKGKGFVKYTVDGVMLELENGDLYGMPFFFFADEDRKALQPGWEEWLKADEEDKAEKQRELELRAQAMQSRRDQKAAVNMSRLQLQLQGYDAGLYDLWRVYLVYPNGRRISVVVPGRSSAEAMQAAAQKYPGLQFGGVAKINRRR